MLIGILTQTQISLCFTMKTDYNWYLSTEMSERRINQAKCIIFCARGSVIVPKTYDCENVYIKWFNTTFPMLFYVTGPVWIPSSGPSCRNTHMGWM